MKSHPTRDSINRWPCTALSVLASLALTGGPAVSAVHAKSVERRSRADADAKRRAHQGARTPGDRLPAPAQSRSDTPSKKQPATASCLAAPCAAKPVDTDSTDLNSCVSIALDDLPRAETFQSADMPNPLLPTSSLHHPSYRAQAPPATTI